MAVVGIDNNKGVSVEENKKLQVEKLSKLAGLGRKLLVNPLLDDGLQIIASCAVDLLGAERCSVFVYDEKRHRLWTKHSDGVERIEMSTDEGIAGATLRSTEAIIVNEPYQDDRFLKKIDLETGYTTRNILSAPIFGAFKTPIGVLQILNKNEGGFDDGDIRILTFFNHYISSYVELAKLKEES